MDRLKTPYTILESLFRVDRSRMPLDAEKTAKVHAREIRA